MPASLNKKQPETEGKERIVGMRLGAKVEVGLQTRAKCGLLPQFNNAKPSPLEPFTYCKGRIGI